MSVRNVPTPTGGWFEPWPVVAEIAEELYPAPLTLVGGLMVQVHAVIGGLAGFRATRDVDLLVDVLSNAASVSTVGSALVRLGFVVRRPLTRGAPIHRFERGDDIVDLLVPDHLRPVPKYSGLSLMAIDGGTQALRKSERVGMSIGNAGIEFLVPDALGALILKAAAHTADTRNRARHRRDTALLASLIDDPLIERKRLQGSDVKRLHRLAEALSDRFDDAWQLLPEDSRQRGQDAVRILAG